jgi:hypothetical protein
MERRKSSRLDRVLCAFLMQIAVQGRLGRHPGSSQRDLAERGARHHPRLRLPGRQFPRLLQRAISGQDRRGQQW